MTLTAAKNEFYKRPRFNAVNICYSPCPILCDDCIFDTAGMYVSPLTGNTNVNKPSRNLFCLARRFRFVYVWNDERPGYRSGMKLPSSGPFGGKWHSGISIRDKRWILKLYTSNTICVQRPRFVLQYNRIRVGANKP